MTTATWNPFKTERPYFTQEHLMFRDSLRKFLEKEAKPFAEEWEENRMVPQTFWDKMGKNGFICPWVDEEYGGLGADFAFSIILAEELGRVGGGGGIGLHNTIVVPYIATFGTAEQKHKYLPGCVNGQIITAIAMSEPGAGSDLAQIKTTAVKKGDHYIINGEKTFISNGISANLIVVACKTNPNAIPAHKGVSLFLVEGDTLGFSRGRKLKKMGQHSQDTAELIFEDVMIPEGNLLGEEGKGFYYLMHKLQQERIMAALGAQVAAEEMLQLTIEYVKGREAFGTKISKFQNTQFKLAEIATQVQIGRTFIDDLISKHMNEEDIVTEVSMAKWWVTDMARRISADCLQLHGGYGYMDEYRISRFYRDVAVGPIYAGSNEIMKVIIAKKLGL